MRSYLAILVLGCLGPAAANAVVSVAALENEEARNLFERCDREAPAGTLVGTELKGFLLALNEPVFQKFDLDCSAELDQSERAAYLNAELAKLDEALDKKIVDVNSRIADTYADESRIPVDEDSAYRISPDPGIEAMDVKLSANFADKPTEEQDTFSLAFSARQQTWRSFRTSVPLTFGNSWAGSIKRSETRTSVGTTQTDEVAFTPITLSTTSEDERFKFKLSGGVGVVRSEQDVFATATTTSERETTFAYALEGSYALGDEKCWSVGLTYEVKTEHLFSDSVSSSLGPSVSYNLLCGR